jgi:hypothetical protein
VIFTLLVTVLQYSFVYKGKESIFVHKLRARPLFYVYVLPSTYSTVIATVYPEVYPSDMPPLFYGVS